MSDLTLFVYKCRELTRSHIYYANINYQRVHAFIVEEWINNVSMNNERRQTISNLDLHRSQNLEGPDGHIKYSVGCTMAVLLVTFVTLSQYRLSLYSMCIYK